MSAKKVKKKKKQKPKAAAAATAGGNGAQQNQPLPPKNNSSSSNSSKCCTKCGARKSSSSVENNNNNNNNNVKLFACSRCLQVKYCSRECQISDWKRHKRAECNSHQLPKKASKALPASFEDTVKQQWRLLELPPMKHPLPRCCCWCCGILIKIVVPPGGGGGSDFTSNPTNDTDGPFWTKSFGYKPCSDGSMFERGKNFPALSIMGKVVPRRDDNVTIRYNAKHEEAIACLYCATKFHPTNNPPDTNDRCAKKHIKRCEEYLCDEPLRRLRESLGNNNNNNNNFFEDITLVEQRVVAIISVELDPNLSNGCTSTGGYMKRERQKAAKPSSSSSSSSLSSSSKKRIEIPYTYQKFEHLAFPAMITEAKEFNQVVQPGGSSSSTDETALKQELLHYTHMRLYSVDNTWRDNSDYITFSLYRLAAYGFSHVRDSIKSLPLSTTIQENDGTVYEIVLRPSFH